MTLDNDNNNTIVTNTNDTNANAHMLASHMLASHTVHSHMIASHIIQFSHLPPNLRPPILVRQQGVQHIQEEVDDKE